MSISGNLIVQVRTTKACKFLLLWVLSFVSVILNSGGIKFIICIFKYSEQCLSSYLLEEKCSLNVSKLGLDVECQISCGLVLTLIMLLSYWASELRSLPVPFLLFSYSTVNVRNYPHIILNASAEANCLQMPVLLKFTDLVIMFRLEGILMKQ